MAEEKPVNAMMKVLFDQNGPSLQISDSDLNKLKISGKSETGTLIQVFDKSGALLCEKSDTTPLHTLTSLQRDGLSPDLIKGISALEKPHTGEPTLADAVNGIVGVAALLTIGLPLNVPPGDIPAICSKPKGQAR